MIATQEREIEIALLRVGNKPANASGKLVVPESLRILDDPKERAPEGHGIFRIMTPKDGDKRVVWDSRSFEQIQEAKAMFDECVAQGLVPYRVGVDGKATSEVMDVFDPHAEEIIFLPVALVAGG